MMSDVSFKSIRDVAEELELEQHVLRFWETKFSQIRPMKRAGGRRYYRSDDVMLLRRIKYLLHTQGYRISGVQKMIKEQGIKEFLKSTETIDGLAHHKKQQNNDSLQKTVLPSGQMSFMVSADSAGFSSENRAELQGILQDLKSIQKALSTV